MAGTTEMSFKKQTASLTFLDGLRGLAALYVMIGHARWLLWEGGEAYSDHAADYSLFEKCQVYFFSFFKYGHEMVLFFFVLSGFVIHLKQAKQLKAGNAVSLQGYFWRRAKRIIPPVLFALLITYSCDKIVEYIGASIFYKATPVAILNANVSFDHSFSTLIGNILFLQQTYVPVFGSNGPLWSLKYEWWFYMLYPLLLIINKRSVTGSLLLVAALSIISLTGWSWGIKLLDDVFAYLICWWLGCFSADIYTGRVRIPSWLFIGATAFILIIPVQHKLLFSSSMIKDIIVAIGFFGLLNFLLLLYNRGTEFKMLNKLKFMGDCSYSMYVIHSPLLVLANGLILLNTNNKMPQTMLFVWLSIPIIVLLAYVVHLFIEKPFIRPVGGRVKPSPVVRSN
jgi:peptidoglycan/LPS O-acetylase OafA/YrhL